MIKYNNQLSFNIIVHNTIKYHRGNLGYRGEFSKRPLKGKLQWTTTKSKSLTAWGPVEQRFDVKVIHGFIPKERFRDVKRGFKRTEKKISYISMTE